MIRTHPLRQPSCRLRRRADTYVIGLEKNPLAEIEEAIKRNTVPVRIIAVEWIAPLPGLPVFVKVWRAWFASAGMRQLPLKLRAFLDFSIPRLTHRLGYQNP